MSIAPRYLITIGYNHFVFKNLKTGVVIVDDDAVIRTAKVKDKELAFTSWEAFDNQLSFQSIAVLGHPRLVINSYDYFMTLLYRAIHKDQSIPLFLMKPDGFLQVERNFEGGLGDVEFRTLTDAMLAAGFKSIRIKKTGLFTEQELDLKYQNSDSIIKFP